MKAHNFKKAVELTTKLQFDDFGFHDNIKTKPYTMDNGITICGYYENWIGLFFDDENGYYSLELREDGWKLCYDGSSFCAIPERTAKQLNAFREYEMGKGAREALEDAEWRKE